MNTLSFNIDKVPSKVFARSSVTDPNSPPGPKTFWKASIVSCTDTFAPAEKPSISLTPRSLKISAEAIPPLKALCICVAVVSKSKPVAAATLPVIFNISPNCSASSETTARFPAPLCISSNEKGTLPANSAMTSKALAPSSTLPNKAFNLT